MKKYFLKFSLFFITLLSFNSVFGATGETILQTNFGTPEMRTICTSIDNCIFYSWSGSILKTYNTLGVLTKQFTAVNTQYKVFTIKNYIIVTSRLSSDRKIRIYKNGDLIIDTSYYLVGGPDQFQYYALNSNNDILYLGIYNNQWFYFDTATEMTGVLTQNITPYNDISNITTKKVQIIGARGYYTEVLGGKNVLEYSYIGNKYLAFQGFDYNITDFSVNFSQDKYYYSFITTDTNPYGYFFSYVIDSNNNVTYDGNKYIQTLYLEEGFTALFYATYGQSIINVGFAPLFVPGGLDATLKYFVSYVNTVNDLVGAGLDIARVNDNLNNDTGLTQTEVKDDLLNIDLNGDGDISIIEATLAPFTILKNIIVKLYSMFENVWKFFKAILNIGNIGSILFETTYAYTGDDVLYKILDKTNNFYSSGSVGAENIHSFIIFSKYGFFFLMFFCILLLFFILYLKNK